MFGWKRLLKVAVTASLVGSLAACGGGGGNSADHSQAGNSGNAAANTSNKQVKLRIMWWGSQDRHQATLAALDLYTKNHPNITFEPEYSGMDGYLDKLSTQAAAKNAPDIVQLDPGWMPDWMSRNQLAPLTDVDVSKFDTKLLAGGSLDGQQYAIPLGSVAFGMIYDKAALDKLGIQTPANGWTWDDFFALAESSKSKLPEGQYFVKDYAANYFVYSAYQYAKGKGPVTTDDGHFNIDRDTFIDWANHFDKLRKEGLVPPADVNTADKELDPQMDLMVSGKILFRYSFSNGLTSWDSLKKGAYSLVTMPRSEQAGGWVKPSMYLAVTNDSKNQKEAIEFVNWFVNDPEAAKTLGTLRGIPANSDSAKILESGMSETDKGGLDMYNASAPDAQIWTAGAGGWTNFIDKDFPYVHDQLSFGKITPEQAFDQLKEASASYEN
ncbi:ABC transporter substrate-binding protein [Paenibacillus antibioticophila]|uniref:ABC transporter substrate-binding protein n=1 Tax=Paenibacillus antibioticophila TaxID=1274374 RepID=A0A919XUC3_9BACL|nr:extracellular solute-binding protein [Paenibacillus antibioticophila]GIO39441.1 ABC transporter substrate-binding protein [Paenibacillus antibioticophila]